MEIKKIDGEFRFYPIDEERCYKSYTTALGAMPSNSFLIKFFKDHTAEQAEKLLKSAGLQGTKVHHTIDASIRGEVIFPTGFTEEQIKKLDIKDPELVRYLRKPFSEREDEMLRGFDNFIHDYKLQRLDSEFVVYSDKVRCAGTVDFYGTIDLPVDGKKVKRLTVKQAAKGKKLEDQMRRNYRSIIDWKTGKGVYEKDHRQVTGYFYAMKEMIKKKILFFKQPEKAFILQLGINACGYKLIEIKDLPRQFVNFCRTNEEWEVQHPNARPASPYNFMESYNFKI